VGGATSPPIREERARWQVRCKSKGELSGELTVARLTIASLESALAAAQIENDALKSRIEAASSVLLLSSHPHCRDAAEKLNLIAPAGKETT
jgi:hypothetical protein